MIKSKTTQVFWKQYWNAPEHTRRAAQKAYRLWCENPRHPSLRFQPKGAFWSVQIARGARALGIYDGTTIIWFAFETSHDEYERRLKS